MIHSIFKILVTSLIFALSLAGYQVQPKEQVGSAVPLYIAAKITYLYGGGISSTASSIKLTSLKTTAGLPITSDQLANAGGTAYATIEPSTSNKETVGCTGVTQNADGTAVLTSCTRGLQFTFPYTASTTLQLSHSGGSSVVFSNSPQLYNDIINHSAGLDQNQSVTGLWTYSIPPIALTEGTSSNQLATQAYANAVIGGGAPTSTATVGGKILLGSAADASQNLNASSSAWAILNPKALTTAIASSSPTLNTQLIPVASTTGYLNVNWISTSSPNGAKNDIHFGQPIFFDGTTTPNTATTTFNAPVKVVGPVRDYNAKAITHQAKSFRLI